MMPNGDRLGVPLSFPEATQRKIVKFLVAISRARITGCSGSINLNRCVIVAMSNSQSSVK